MSYFPMFLDNSKWVENTFKSATTTTAARFFKTIFPEAGPTFCMTFPVRGWRCTVGLLLKSFAGWKKTIKESAISEEPQSVFDWLGSWNPHENENSHPGSTLPNLASSTGPRSLSWEVDDRKRDEEDEAGANLRTRRGRFVNDKVDMEV